MRAAVAVRGTAASLVLAALAAVPATGAPAGDAPSPVAGSPAATSAAAGRAEALGTAVAAGRAAAEGIRFGPCPEGRDVPGTFRCGTVTVPLDYAHPDGERIGLAVSRVRATGGTGAGKPGKTEGPGKAKGPGTAEGPGTARGSSGKVARQGSLVYNPGGPGASGLSFPMVGTLPKWKRIAAAYDLVGYAPRGVGRSAPLSCRDPRSLGTKPEPAPEHPSEAYKRERIARAEAYARGCAERAGDALRHYTSLNNARDLEVLRAALGERRLTFMGASYGTYLGGLYATLFPGHVRRMVFDAPVNPDPERIWYRNNLGQSLAFERRWADFRSWVARHDRAYRLGRTPGEVQAAYERAGARLAAKPAGGTVGPGQLHDALLQAAYYDSHWPSRAEALSAYLHGDEKPLLRLAGPHPGAEAGQENGSAVYTAVECNDAPWPADWRVWDRDNTRLARVAPFETWDNVWANLPCAYWPVARRRPLDVGTRPGQLPPTLILAAERDAAAPYEGALELWRRLAGSVLVTERDAGTHGTGGGANACVNAHLEAYLLEGGLPARRADCAARAEPEPAARDGRARQGAAGGAVRHGPA
ncbi:alpha/beta hydrolase [Streptomyces minutiscleroticus]|uniref:Protease n=1 Tax=Streptomyces minutiscleroticus TaxID=68238 RepID=A0A918U6Z1_9ACTN|nr:alpha/beta hydrolase [Streptomyces minutiscleroticus]GGY02332.1 protease [Streptomyces minutiscleroticus]